MQEQKKKKAGRKNDLQYRSSSPHQSIPLPRRGSTQHPRHSSPHHKQVNGNQYHFIFLPPPPPSAPLCPFPAPRPCGCGATKLTLSLMKTSPRSTYARGSSEPTANLWEGFSLSSASILGDKRAGEKLKAGTLFVTAGSRKERLCHDNSGGPGRRLNTEGRRHPPHPPLCVWGHDHKTIRQPFDIASFFFGVRTGVGDTEQERRDRTIPLLQYILCIKRPV